MIWSLIAVPLGFVLDLIFGDPHGALGKIHPVVLIGKVISFFEKLFRGMCPKTVRGENLAGALVWFFTIDVTVIITCIIIILCYTVYVPLGILVESIMCWQILAVKSLKTESMKVYDALENGTIEDARYAVSMIVGRDTAELSDAAVTRAAVETVAENTSDGVVAPLFYIAFAGAVGGFLYKAVNTMDSMLGYIEEPYKNVGFVPAKADDLFNFIPARISAVFMLIAGKILRLDVKNGYRVFRRDRYNHASPNSAQTESVCAGLLGLRLAGDAYYHGVLHKKKYIGDEIRSIEHEDIKRACRLMYVTSFISVIFALAVRALILCAFVAPHGL